MIPEYGELKCGIVHSESAVIHLLQSAEVSVNDTLTGDPLITFPYLTTLMYTQKTLFPLSVTPGSTRNLCYDSTQSQDVTSMSLHESCTINPASSFQFHLRRMPTLPIADTAA